MLQPRYNTSSSAKKPTLFQVISRPALRGSACGTRGRATAAGAGVRSVPPRAAGTEAGDGPGRAGARPAGAAAPDACGAAGGAGVVTRGIAGADSGGLGGALIA